MGVLVIAVVLIDAGDSNSHGSSDRRGKLDSNGDPGRDGIPIVYYGLSVVRNCFLGALSQRLVSITKEGTYLLMAQWRMCHTDT